MFIEWPLKRRGVYLLFSIRWVEIKIDTRRKMEREESIERLEILTRPCLTRRMGSCDFPIFNLEVKSKWKTYLSLCFARLTTRKLKRKEMCKTLLRMLCIVVCFCNFWTPCSIVNFYNSWTFQLWKVVLEVFETKRKKEMKMKQVKRWNEKAWCHERIEITWEKITRRQTKLWLGRNYLKKIDKEIVEHIDIKGEKDFWKP